MEACGLFSLLARIVAWIEAIKQKLSILTRLLPFVWYLSISLGLVFYVYGVVSAPLFFCVCGAGASAGLCVCACACACVRACVCPTPRRVNLCIFL